MIILHLGFFAIQFFFVGGVKVLYGERVGGGWMCAAAYVQRICNDSGVYFFLDFT